MGLVAPKRKPYTTLEYLQEDKSHFFSLIWYKKNIMIISLISWLLFGFIAGSAAKYIMPGDEPGGALSSIGLGVVGSMLGGTIGWLLGLGSGSGWSIYNFLLAIGGSLILIYGYNLLKKGKE